MKTTSIKQYTDTNNNTITLDIGNIVLYVKKKETCWVAYSPQFKTLGFSEEGEEAAVVDFRESLDIFFDVHLERGTLAKALSSFGWKQQDDTFQKPKYFNHPIVHTGGQQQKFQYA